MPSCCCNPNGSDSGSPSGLNVTGSAWAAGTVAPGAAVKYSTPVDLAVPGGSLSASQACVIWIRTSLIPDAAGYVRADVLLEVSADGGTNYFNIATANQAINYGAGVPQALEYVSMGEVVQALGPVTPTGGVLKCRIGLSNNAASAQPAQLSTSQVTWAVGNAL